jgi:alpha-L-fucosidase
VKTGRQLVDLYLTSVGRNSKLLLNVPPTRAGLLHTTDVTRLKELRTGIAELTARDVTAGREQRWRMTGDRSAVCEIELKRSESVGLADFREHIEQGQVVSRYILEGASDVAGASWRALSRGTTIGHRKLDLFAPAVVRRVRLTLEAVAPLPKPPRVRLYAAEVSRRG